MKKFKVILIGLGIIMLLNGILMGINILQKGIGGYKGESMQTILGVDPATATIDDLKKLDKAQIFQLFYAATAPEFASMKGEYKAKTLPLGIMAASADFFTHNFFGPGHWEGKAFFPFEKIKGWGYNLFKVSSDDKVSIARTRKMNTYVGKSTIDDRNSFHLDYSPFNGGLVHSMHDEIRKVNDRLFICMGHMAAGGGSINPAPFILHGEPSPWVGPDK